jgi:hypothetical protein
VVLISSGTRIPGVGRDKIPSAFRLSNTPLKHHRTQERVVLPGMFDSGFGVVQADAIVKGDAQKRLARRRLGKSELGQG